MKKITFIPFIAAFVMMFYQSEAIAQDKVNTIEYKKVTPSPDSLQETVLGNSEANKLMDGSIDVVIGPGMTKHFEGVYLGPGTIDPFYFETILEIPDFMTFETDDVKGNLYSMYVDFTLTTAGDALPGDYTIRVEYSFHSGGEVHSTQILTINLTIAGPPIADFSGSPTEGDAPLIVRFTDQSKGYITSWQWDFGDGRTSSSQNPPSHNFPNPGTYTIRLTVTGPGGSDTKIKSNYITVNVPPPPVADFTGSPTEGDAPLSVKFTDLSTGYATSWDWDFGDGETSTWMGPVHTYQNSGTYTVSLTVTGPGGSDTKTRSNYITVNEPPSPVADFTASPRKGDAPLTVQFTDQSTGNITSWDWDFGDGETNTLSNPLHTYQNPGIYTVALTVEGLGGSDTETKNDCIMVNFSGFGSQQVITTLAEGARSVYAADLDGDGDMDVLSASWTDNKIAWYENDGNGNFGSQQVITTSADGANSVYAADLDGDGDIDVLSASYDDDSIAWYENDGTGNFGSQQVITTLANGARSVYSADLNGDGDLDVLSASSMQLTYPQDNKIAWYENDGSGGFGEQQIITTLTEGANSVYTADLDGDGDLDVLSASEYLYDNKIAWYENNGSGGFGEQQIITTLADGANSVYAADLDGDGDMDVLSASNDDGRIAWYENDSTGSFGEQQVITTSADAARSVHAADLDGDGDLDVLSASWNDNKIAYYENDGTGSFGAQRIITVLADGAAFVYAADLDGDGDVDVLSASWAHAAKDDDKIAWYENLMTMPNHSPIIANTMSDTVLVAGGADFTRDLNAAPAIFSDPDSDELTYTATCSAPSIANASVSGSILTVSPLSEGTTSVTVTADDGKGGTASTDFVVEVRSGKVEVTFNVNVPTSTPANDIIYLAGTFNFWDPGPAQTGTDGNEHDLPLIDIGNNKHQITLSFNIGKSIEYKYTRGSWESVEKGAQGEEISNRTLIVPDSNYTRYDGVANWSDITLNPNIVVTPDTLFFAVGTKNSKSWSILKAKQNLQSARIMPDGIFRVNPSAEIIQLSSITPLQLSLSEWDTLSNSFETHFYMFEQYQTRYEVTRLIPDKSCKLEALRFAFYNYQDSEKSKDCELFVLDDNGGKPGTKIWSGNVTLTYPAVTFGWLDFNMTDKDIHLNEFWIGHQEKTGGAPTSVHDTLGTPGRNCYSWDGISWSQIDDDYLQQAIVSYNSSDYESFALLSVKNTGNGDLHVSDIYCNEDWVKSISSKSFTLEPAGQKNVEICCTADNLNDGQYFDNLKITSDDPDTPVYDVRLIFNVIVTSIQDNYSNILTEFALKQNYPNPFNPTTTIQFEVPKTSHVSIKIYDLLGNKVKTLVDGKYQPGSHSEVWDGRDDKRFSLASGTYLMKMQAGKFALVKKMLLLK